MIFSLPCFSLVSPSKRLTLNLFMKWDYKQWEIHQTSPIPFHWKRLKLALGKAVSASCSSNLATTSVGEPSRKGERGCVSCQTACFFFFFALFLLFWKSILSFVVHKGEKKGECGCLCCGTHTSETTLSLWLMLRLSTAKLNLAWTLEWQGNVIHACSH